MVSRAAREAEPEEALEQVASLAFSEELATLRGALRGALEALEVQAASLVSLGVQAAPREVQAEQVALVISWEVSEAAQLVEMRPAERQPALALQRELAQLVLEPQRELVRPALALRRQLARPVLVLQRLPLLRVPLRKLLRLLETQLLETQPRVLRALRVRVLERTPEM